MTRLTRSIIENNLPPVFTSDDVKKIEPDDNIRYCQMLRSLSSGDIIRIYRGIYTLNQIFRKGTINLNALAYRLVPESYISLETALWDAGWIPEFVFEISSVCQGHSFEIKTEFSTFSYTQIRQKNLFCGTYTISSEHGPIVEAKPLKALADYVYDIDCQWNSIYPLIHSLRIDIENLETLTVSDFNEIEGNYESKNVEKFIYGIRKELKI
jgi:hypothetical protein